MTYAFDAFKAVAQFVPE